MFDFRADFVYNISMDCNCSNKFVNKTHLLTLSVRLIRDAIQAGGVKR